DEEMAHMISLGGWLRGFQLGATSTQERYSEAKAKILGRIEVVEYFLDRLDTLNPRLKQTEMVTAFIGRLREIRLVMVEAEGQTPTEAQVGRFKKLADEAEAVATARVDADGKFLEKPKL
ncbi:MAG: hypothetical protein ACO3GO_05740, partial [Terrimicrobiaceae bacterium]